MKLNCIIVEDQLPAQRILKTYIKDIPELHLLGSCVSALEATAILQDNAVDLMFLDINLPKISGISFLKNLSHPPKVIITSAYSDYALEGFELDVVDYLLKPFSFERFHKAVVKATNQQTAKGENREFLFLKSDKVFHKVEIAAIRYIQSDDNYVKIFTEDKMHMQMGSLQNWVEDLPDQFIRVHKSYVVNLSKVDKLSGNRLYLGHQEIPVGRSYREALLKHIVD